MIQATPKQIFMEAIELFDLDAMKKAGPGMDNTGPSSEYYENWVQAWKRQNANVLDLLAGLDIIKKYAGRPAIDNETLCTHLLRANNPLCRQWAKRNHLPLRQNNYFLWLDVCIGSISELDPRQETGWIVHSNKAEDFHGALLALAVFGGQSSETLDFLSAQCAQPSGDQIAKGLCSVLYRHLGNEVETPLLHTHESLEWAGRQCKPKMFRRAAAELLMDDENYDYLVKPLIASIKAAPANLAAASLDAVTNQAPSGPRSVRL